MGGDSLLKKTEIQGGEGVLSEIPAVVGVWIFSGTTQLDFKYIYLDSIFAIFC